MYLNQQTNTPGLTIDHVRAAYPECSIPDGIAFEEFVPYEPSAIPEHNTYTHTVQELPPVLVEGVLTQRWEVVTRGAPVVPATVTRRQARQALLLAGLLNQVPAAIAAIPDPVLRDMAQIEWDDSQTFERHRPLLIQLASALGLNSAALDNLFIQAAQL